MPSGKHWITAVTTSLRSAAGSPADTGWGGGTIRHREDDTIRQGDDASVAALEKLDAPVRFTKLTDEETPESPSYVAYMEHHNAWTPAYKVDSPMWAWLFAQSREEGA